MISLFGARTRKDWLFLLLAIIALGWPRVLIQSAASTTFLQIYGAAFLAWIYLSVALTIPVCIALFLQVEKRVSRVSLLRGTQVGRIAMLGLLWLGSRGAYANWFAIAAVIWLEVEFALGSLVFWGLAGESFKISEAKKSFAFLAGGEQFGSMLAGFAVPALMFKLSPSDLYMVAAAAIGLSIVLLFQITRSVQGISPPTRQQKKQASDRPPPLNRAMRAYLVLMFVCVILGNVGYYLVDNAFYRSVAQAFPAEEQMASFIGATFGIAGAVTLLFSTFAAARVMARYGVAVIVSWLPIAVGVTTLVLLLGNWIPVFPAALSFVLIVALKVGDDGLRICIYGPAFQTLYQPLPVSQRILALAWSEGLFVPLGVATAGLVVLGAAYLGLGMFWMGLVGLFTFIIWTLATLALRRAYSVVVDLAVKSRQNVSFSPEALAGPDTRSLLLRKLKSGSADEVLGAMELLSSTNRTQFLQMAPGLVLTGERRVVQAIIAKLDAAELKDLAPILKNRYLHEHDMGFRRPLFTALAMSGHASANPVLMAQIRSEGPFQDVALPSLMNSGLVAHAQAAVRRMKQLAVSENPDDQRLFLSAVAKTRSNRFDADIQRLFNAANLATARLAMRSAGQTGRSVFVGPLLLHMRDAAFVEAAGAALVLLGDAAVQPLGSCLVSPAPPALCQAAARRLGEIGSAEAVGLLKQHLTSVEPLVLQAVGRALWWAEAVLQGGESGQALRNATRLFHAAVEGHAMMASLADVPDAGLLRQALERQIASYLGGAFIWLALRKRLFDIDLAPLLAARGSGVGQSYLEELAHSLVPSGLRGLVDALIHEAPSDVWLEQIKGVAKPAALQPRDVIRQLATGTPTQMPWTRVAALAAAVNVHPEAKLLCATMMKERGLAGDVARELLASPEFKSGDRSMGLNTIEKILLLKSFELFKPVPDDVLAAFAPVIATASFARGETIAAEQSAGDCLYVLATGEVTVQGKKQAARLISSPAIIDELSALSPTVRQDTLIAASDCELLVVTHEDFESMIGSDPATSLGIVRVLSERLRRG
jgi:ATP/ADP translocase